MTHEKKVNFLVNFVFVLTVLFLVFFFLRYVMGYIFPFLIGFFISFLLKPAVDFLEEKCKLPRKPCSVLVITVVYLILIALFWLAGAWLVSETGALFGKLPELYQNKIQPLIDSFQKLIQDFSKRLSPDVSNQLSDLLNVSSTRLQDFIGTISASVLSFLTDLAAKIPGFLMTLTFTVISSVYFILDYRLITRFLMHQLPERLQPWLIETKNFLVGVLLQYLKAYFILMLITFAEIAVWLSVAKIEYAVPIAIVVALFDLLPVIGTGAIFFPWSIVSVLQRDFYTASVVILLYLFVNAVRAAVEPKIVGKSIGLHPLVTLIAVFLGIRLFGVVGVLAPIGVLLLKYLNDTGKLKLWK